MTIKLATTTTSTASSNESILSPKIIEHLKSKLSRPAVLSSETTSQVLASYIMARPVPRELLRAVVRSLHWPMQILAVEIVPSGSASPTSYSTICRNIASYAAEAQLPAKLIYLGNASFCLCVTPSQAAEQIYLDFKKIAKLFDCEVSMGIGPQAIEPRQLRSAYSAALRIARLGHDLFGKPYRYGATDLGVLALLVGSEAQREAAKDYAQHLLDGLAKPKSLLPTLRKLFEHTMSPSEAARALQVHRNTVIYRLAKIRAQTGLDVLDFGDALQLRLAVALYDVTAGNVMGPNVMADTPTGEVPSLCDYYLQTAFTSPGMADEVIRSWGESIGVELPTSFYCYLVEGKLSQDYQTIVKNTSVIASTVLSNDTTFLLVEATPKLATRFASELARAGRVAWVGSDDLAGSLSTALSTLEEYLVLSSLTSPCARVVCRHDVGSYGVFLGDHVSATAQAFATAIAKKLAVSPQLARTVDTLLDSSLNLTLAARRLKVHRNTLIYRIGRIKHLLGYDMTVFEDAVQVRLALLISQLT